MMDQTPGRWLEQYARMLRQRARLDAPAQSAEHHRDDFYDFFVAAYHLADWIKNDDTVDEQARGAAWVFRHMGDLALAGDVANGFKHLKRDRKNVDADAHVTVLPGHPARLDDTQLDVGRLGTIVIAGDTTWDDAFEVADRCIAQWNGFLRVQGLQP